MPPRSQKQRNLMFAAKNDPAVRKRTGISKSVAQDFTSSDPGGKLPKYTKKKRPGVGILSKSRL